MEMAGEDPASLVSERLSGLGVSKGQAESGIKKAGLKGKPSGWTRDDLLKRLDTFKAGREFFSSGFGFRLEQNNVTNHIKPLNQARRHLRILR